MTRSRRDHRAVSAAPVAKDSSCVTSSSTTESETQASDCDRGPDGRDAGLTQADGTMLMLDEETGQYYPEEQTAVPNDDPQPKPNKKEKPKAAILTSFYLYAPQHKYIYTRTGDLWPG